MEPPDFREVLLKLKEVVHVGDANTIPLVSWLMA